MAEFSEKIDEILKVEDNKENSFEKVEKFLDSLTRFTIKHTINDTKDFLAFLGNPDKKMKVIHVAGTNGKGSVCNYITGILMQANYHVGMFTSPHLVQITERFQVDKKNISNETFVELFYKVLHMVLLYQKKNNDFFPSYFEYLFFMGMELFGSLNLDYVILETGLGGRLDATNTVEKPLVCAITEIGLDHMQYLGNTFESIASQKAGIIKKGVPIVYIDKRPESSKVIEDKARECNSRIIKVSNSDISNITKRRGSDGKNHIDFCYNSSYYKYVDLSLLSPALYQTENAAIAISVAEQLRLLGADITNDDIYKGIASSLWMCRMDEVKEGFFVDGAHNADGIEAFVKSVSEMDIKGKRYLLFGVVGDKQYLKMIDTLLQSKLFSSIDVAVLETGRSLSRDELRESFFKEREKNTDTQIFFHDNVEEALKAVALKKNADDCIFAAGSLYLAGQISGLINKFGDIYDKF